jgi:hypothetical protein
MQLSEIDDINLAALLSMLLAAQAAAYMATGGPLVYSAIVRVVDEIFALGRGRHTESGLLWIGAEIEFEHRRDFVTLIRITSAELDDKGFQPAAQLLERSAAEGLTTTMPAGVGHLAGVERRTH